MTENEMYQLVSGTSRAWSWSKAIRQNGWPLSNDPAVGVNMQAINVDPSLHGEWKTHNLNRILSYFHAHQ